MNVVRNMELQTLDYFNVFEFYPLAHLTQIYYYYKLQCEWHISNKGEQSLQSSPFSLLFHFLGVAKLATGSFLMEPEW